MWVTSQSALTRGARVKLRTALVQRTQAGLDISSFYNQKRDFFFFFPFKCWVFAAAQGRLLSSCGRWRLLLGAVRALLIAVASLVAKYRL